jgi:PAS domain S-box-containing protein
MALKSTEILIAPEDRDQAKAMHNQRLQGKPSPLDWEYRGLKKNGEKIWVGKRAFFIDWDGETAICSVRFDITERKRAEQALRESEERFRTLFNSSPQGILVHRQHKPLYANQALADMYGYGAIAEILSMRTTLDLIAPESRSPTGDAWLLAKADSFDKEYFGVKKDGEKIWVQKRSFRINWDGKPAICSMRTNITQRKETEERIRKSEEQFRLAIANLQEAFALYDSDDRLVIYNDEFVRLHPAATDIIKPGVTWKEIMLKTLESGRNALARGREEEYIREREDLHKNPKGPILRYNTDGKWRIINEVKLPDGGTVVVQTDITELKKLEEEALKAQELLQSAIESIAGGFSLYDSEGRLTLANTNNYEYFNDVRDIYRPGALFEDVLRARAKRGLIDGVDGDVEKWVQERVNRFRSRKTTSHLRRDRGRWMQINEYPTGDGGKAIIRTDITESKEVMDALRVSEERFKTLVDSSNQGILIHRHYKPLYANNALAKIFGYDSAAEIMNLSTTKTLLKRRSRHDDGPLRLHDARLRGEPVPDEYEFRTARKDGSPIWVNNRAFRIEWEGEPAICTTLFDITERKLAESQLVQSSKLASLGELASSIAHELNQPLGIVRIVAESALIKAEESKTLNLDYTRKQLTAICDQAERMASITNHLRLFSRLDEGDVTLFDPSESLQNAVNLIEQPFRLSGIKFIKKIPNESRQVLGSNIKLEQVILNLLNNAADAVNDRAEHEDNEDKKYTPRISISLTDNKRSQGIIIRVKDNGGGIPQESLQKIFDPFFTTKDAGHGTGLGLSISFGIVKSMQGILDVENHPDGALFTITLPAQEHMEIPIKQNKALPAKSTSGRANEKNTEGHGQNTVTGKHNGNGKAKGNGNGKLPFVIVVDDELLAAESIAEHLQYSGYTVFTANNGAEALSLCKKDIPDAVITDLRMPVMDGFTLIRELKAKHPTLPIIVTTGHANLEDEDTAVTDGAAVVLWKPIKLNDLTRKLSELIN